MELIGYFEDAGAENDGGAPYRVSGTKVPVWILGSSLYGAQLAAHLGLPYAFASHFAPAALEQALTIYRQTFQPSARWPAPCFMLAINAFAGETGRRGPLPEILGAAVVRQPAQRPAGPPAPSRRRPGIRDRPGDGPRWSTKPCPAR